MSDKRPPNDRGQGRKPLPPEEKVRVRTVRMTDEQWAKFSALGGAAWLRERIDRAKMPS
jgi:hypothetical protein